MKNIFALLICVALFATCKKYPDGGFTKRGPKNIIGEWKLTLYEVDGIDSTDLINYNNDEGYKNVSFLKEQTKYSPHLYVNMDATNQSQVDFISSNTKIKIQNDIFSNNGKECAIHYFSFKCYRLFFYPEGITAEWDILELTKTNLVLSYRNKNNYKLTFTK